MSPQDHPTTTKKQAEAGASPAAARVEQGPAKFIIFGVVALVFTVLDQVTKIWVQRNIDLYREEIPVIDGFFSLVHAENEGAAFGILSEVPYRMYIFAAFTLVALVVLFQMLWQLPKNDRFQTVALGLITSGAVGNAIDRVQKQSVTDFLKVYTDHPGLSAWLEDKVGTRQWPSFNVADAAIVVGLGMFLVHFLFMQKDDETAKAKKPKKSLDADVVGPAAAAPVAAPQPPVARSSTVRAPRSTASASVSDPGDQMPMEDMDAEAPTELVTPTHAVRTKPD